MATNIPQLSDAERKAALEKAKEARIKRAEVREQLKSGKLTLAQVIEMKDDPVVGRMKVSTLIETLPGYGKAKSEKIMNELQIAESRRLRYSIEPKHAKSIHLVRLRYICRPTLPIWHPYHDQPAWLMLDEVELRRK